MDPNAALDRLRDFAAMILANESLYDASAIELAEMVQDLDGWLAAGGFLPRAWRSAKPF